MDLTEPSIVILLVVLCASLLAWTYAVGRMIQRRPVFELTKRPRLPVSDYSIAAVGLLLILGQLSSAAATTAVSKRIENKATPRVLPTEGVLENIEDVPTDEVADESPEPAAVAPLDTKVQVELLLNGLMVEAFMLGFLLLIHLIAQDRVATKPAPLPNETPFIAGELANTPPMPPAHRAGYEIMQGALAFLLCLPWVFLFNYAIRELTKDESLHELLVVVQQDQSPLLLLLVAAHAIVMAPLLEELQFRVILQGWLADRVRGWLAVTLIALMFCGVHRFPDAFALLPLALALGWLYHRRGSYLGVVTTHMLFNVFNLTMMLLGA